MKQHATCIKIDDKASNFEELVFTCVQSSMGEIHPNMGIVIVDSRIVDINRGCSPRSGHALGRTDTGLCLRKDLTAILP